VIEIPDPHAINMWFLKKISGDGGAVFGFESVKVAVIHS
jgi:hypothetical protein